VSSWKIAAAKETRTLEKYFIAVFLCFFLHTLGTIHLKLSIAPQTFRSTNYDLSKIANVVAVSDAGGFCTEMLQCCWVLFQLEAFGFERAVVLKPSENQMHF
jgi:hypothetical protein